MKVLMVEDSDAVRRYMTEFLLGINNVECVYVAETLQEARDSVHRDRPDLVILDVNLPDGNAIDVIGLFKQTAPDMLIAMFTNDVSEFTKASRCRLVF
ncbi:MAG: response regulator [Gallionella sp.]